MKPKWRAVLSVFAVLAWLAPAQADFQPGDVTKWVQLPDPTGFNVRADSPFALWDDFPCQFTGPITNLHIWGSFLSNQLNPNLAFAMGIYDNVPAGPNQPYSKPGNFLQFFLFNPGQYLVAGPYQSQELYLDPPGNIMGPEDHYWLFNFYLSPTQAFIQKSGNIYWLGVSVFDTTNPNAPPFFGWKTSTTQWGDDAVYFDFTRQDYSPLVNPLTGASLDLAFAVTTVPVPGTFILLGSALLGLVRWRKGRK